MLKISHSLLSSLGVGKGFQTLLGIFFFSLALGSCNALGGIIMYIVSWQKETNKSVLLEQVALVLPFNLIAVYACISLSLKIGSYFGYRNTLRFVSVAFPVGVCLSSYTSHWIVFALVYGASCCVLGAGFMIPLYCGWELMPDNRGRVTGVVACSFSLSPLLFNFLTYAIANPRNIDPTVSYPGENTKYYEVEVTERIPMMLRGMALVLIFLNLLGSSLIWTPEDIAQERADINADYVAHLVQDAPSSADTEASSAEVSPSSIQQFEIEEAKKVQEEKNAELNLEDLKKIALSKKFWILYLMYLGGLLMPQFMIAFYKAFGQDRGLDDQFLTFAGSAGSVSSAMAGLAFGYLAEKFPFKRIAFILYAVMLGCTIALPLTATFKPMYMILAVTILSGMGANGSIYPTELAKIYGNARGGIMYGLINTANIVSIMLIVGLVNILKDMISYTGIIFILSGVVGLALFLLFNHESAAQQESDKIQEVLVR